MSEATYNMTVRRIMDDVHQMSAEQKAALAGEILEAADVHRDTFITFWSVLSEPSQEQLGGYLSLYLDGDEEEANAG